MGMETTDNQHDFSYPIIPVVNGPCDGQRWKNAGKSVYIESETVNHPSHYNQYGVECIDVAEQMNFNMGNALKYIWRCGDKGNPIEDLKKAKWYIERELQRIENE